MYGTCGDQTVRQPLRSGRRLEIKMTCPFIYENQMLSGSSRAPSWVSLSSLVANN